MSIAELSERSGVPVRTVRFYQSEQLIPPPKRVGRSAHYDETHIERLRLIGDLRDRGLRLSAIREVLTRAGEGAGSISAWLGLDKTLSRPWTDDLPGLWTQEELHEQLKGRAIPVEALEAHGLIERRIDTAPLTYLVPSPGLLNITLELLDLGVSPETIVAARDVLRRHLGRLVDDLVAHISIDPVIEHHAREGLDWVAELIERLRPMGQRAVSVVFSHEMERALRDIASILDRLREVETEGS